MFFQLTAGANSDNTRGGNGHDKTKKGEKFINLRTQHLFEEEELRLARTVVLKWLSETSVLITTDANGVVQLQALENFKQDYQYIVARGLINVYPQRPFYIIIYNASNSVII